MDVWGLVLAGGSGARFGGLKQLQRLDGQTLIDRAVDALTERCDRVVVVLHDEARWSRPGVVTVTGGADRAASVRAGLAVVPADAVVVVHDPAHPLASADLVGRVVEPVVTGRAVAAIPVWPVNDTVKRVGDDGMVAATLPRGLVTTQMPHAYRADVLAAAHRSAATAQDDSGLVEALGHPVLTVPGEATNLHVTTPAELDLATRLID